MLGRVKRERERRRKSRGSEEKELRDFKTKRQ